MPPLTRPASLAAGSNNLIFTTTEYHWRCTLPLKSYQHRESWTRMLRALRFSPCYSREIW